MEERDGVIIVDATPFLKLTKYEDVKTSDPIKNKYLRAKLKSSTAFEVGISFDYKKFRK